jgi:hypothetical protein
VLGADAFENGLNCMDRISEDCISKEARRHIDSLGMIKLETMPSVTKRVKAGPGNR